MTRDNGPRALEGPPLHAAAALYFVETTLYALGSSVLLAVAFASIAAFFALLALSYSADVRTLGVG
jgi:hypothetical protein